MPGSNVRALEKAKTLAADGDRFQLYRIEKAESLNVTKSKTKID